MAYFQNFETLVYDVVGDGNPKLFTHILRRVKINDLVKDNILLYDFIKLNQARNQRMLHMIFMVVQNYIG